MELKTKYTPGQKLWAIYHNKVQDFLIEKVIATCNLNYDTMQPHTMIHALYYLRIGLSSGARKECSEEELDVFFFSSKEELIKSL